MTGKFASALVLLVLTVVLAAGGFAQTVPAGQAPDQTAPAAGGQQPAAPNPSAQTPTAQQSSSSQEAAEEESTSVRKRRPHDYKNWVFNVGAGANLDSGATKTFVRGGGVDATIGVARNANKYLGLRADFIAADLPLRDSTQELAQATGATSYMLAVTLDPIINIPVTKEYSGYVLFGPGFFHRAGSLQTDTTVPGSACNSFWVWWGTCFNSSLPLDGSFVNTSQNQFGYNAGAGVARKMPSGVEIYAEYRLIHASGNSTTTDVRPITIGVRW